MPEPDIKLAAFDMEGCLTDDPTVWEIMHGKVGTWQSHGVRYWERYRAGELDYDTFARLDVAAWRNAPCSLLESAAREVKLMPGCVELLGDLRRAGVTVAVVSNGILHVADRFRTMGVEHVFANRVIVRDGRLTGEIDICLPYHHKGQVLRRLAATLGVARAQIAAIGDSPQDIEMFEEARLSVAFCPRHPSVAHAASHVVQAKDLRTLTDILLPSLSA